ncbi:MAG: hypothetical protein ACU0CA_01080 [Paracoccaceae bacterium]
MNCEVMNVEIVEARRSGVARLVHWLRERQQQRRDRAGFAQMLKLEDHMLADIGVSRGAVDWAQGLLASRNPGLELAKAVGRIGVIAPR